jgi:hypothetical protein
MRSFSPLGVTFLGVAIVLVAGCEGAKGRQKVSGTILFNGKLLDKGTIEFHPEDKGASFSGAPIADGKYEIPAMKGLLPGKYKVMISSADAVLKEDPAPGESGPPAKERIPEKYNVKSTEIVEVKKGVPNVFDFDIK